MHKAIAYFFLGFVAGLAVMEFANGKPPVKINHSVNGYPIGYDYHFRPWLYRSGVYQYNPYSQGNNSGSRANTSNGGENRGGNRGNTGRGIEQGENHGRTIEVNDRKKN